MGGLIQGRHNSPLVEPCDECKNSFMPHQLECVGGALFCRECMEDFESRPAPTAEELRAMDDDSEE